MLVGAEFFVNGDGGRLAWDIPQLALRKELEEQPHHVCQRRRSREHLERAGPISCQAQVHTLDAIQEEQMTDRQTHRQTDRQPDRQTAR